MEITDKQLAELRYIAKRGPLYKRVPLNSDPELMEYIHKGLLAHNQNGYSITAKGRQIAGAPTAKTCSLCGHPLPL